MQSAVAAERTVADAEYVSAETAEEAFGFLENTCTIDCTIAGQIAIADQRVVVRVRECANLNSISSLATQGAMASWSMLRKRRSCAAMSHCS